MGTSAQRVLRSMSSLNEILNSDELDVDEAWRQDLADRIDEILDTKRSSIRSREKALATFNHFLILRHAEDEIDGKEKALAQALLRIIKTYSSEKETVLALKALELMTVTSPIDTLYADISTALRSVIADSHSMAVKAAAIHTLGFGTYYGSASEEETLDSLAYFLEIVASDGDFIAAQDEPSPVTAALLEWGFLATDFSYVEDLGIQEALDSFTDQLSSTDTNVQIAAGENIALLYEKVNHVSSTVIGGSDSDSDSNSDPNGDFGSTDPDVLQSSTSAAKSYLERMIPTLLPNLSALASLSTASISKKSRKALHSAFSSIAYSVEHPWAGPAFSSALKQDSDALQGNRMKLKTKDGRVMNIDRWWKLLRLNAFRRVLRDGLMLHLRENPAVRDALPKFGMSKYMDEKARKKETKKMEFLGLI